MRLPLSWLKQYVPSVPSAPKLAEALMMHGLEVEEIIDRRGQYDHVVVGEIVGIKPHPNADKLRLADVVYEIGGRPQTVVCGAPNIAVGQKVPVALLGAKLPNGMVIEKRPIRGVESSGMLCAADELGLGRDHSGILILDQALKVGTPFAAAMGFDDVTLDVSTPANRSDLMSVRGLAREIAALLGATFREPRSVRVSATAKKILGVVRVADPKLCPVYTARVIHGVSSASSPALVQKRLLAADMRPINAVVDATNYAMLEYGQPQHAFDAAKVKGAITVRSAKAGEHLVTLDGQDRKLDPTMLVIADSRGPIALAGVMGGKDSEVTESTTDIILESAIFDPVSIRRTSRALGLVSEASKRFEKGLPRSLPDEAGRATAEMIATWCHGTIDKNAATVGATKVKQTVIAFLPAYVTERLGMTVAPAKAKTILKRLGFTVTGSTKWKVTVPPWRLDVSLPEDLVDEIGRMVGYEDLPESWSPTTTAPNNPSKTYLLKQDVADYLQRVGLIEVVSHSYYGNAAAKFIGGKHYEVSNPLDATQQYLRKSLLPQIFESIEYAADQGSDVSIFEIGRSYNPESNELVAAQPWKLALGMAVKAREGSVHERKLMGVIQGLYEYLGVAYPRTITVNVRARKGRLLMYAELDLNALAARVPVKRFAPTPKFPSVVRDVSFEITSGKPYTDFEKVVRDSGQPFLRNVELLDVYRTGNTYICTTRLKFFADNRTLTKDEVDKVEKRIKEALVTLGATIR